MPTLESALEAMGRIEIVVPETADRQKYSATWALGLSEQEREKLSIRARAST